MPKLGAVREEEETTVAFRQLAAREECFCCDQAKKVVRVDTAVSMIDENCRKSFAEELKTFEGAYCSSRLSICCPKGRGA